MYTLFELEMKVKKHRWLLTKRPWSLQRIAASLDKCQGGWAVGAEFTYHKTDFIGRRWALKLQNQISGTIQGRCAHHNADKSLWLLCYSSNHLPVYTCSRNGATIALLLSCVSVHLGNTRPLFILFLAWFISWGKYVLLLLGEISGPLASKCSAGLASC